jgi:hypothetical protein
MPRGKKAVEGTEVKPSVEGKLKELKGQGDV